MRFIWASGSARNRVKITIRSAVSSASSPSMLSLICGRGTARATDVRKPCFSSSAAIIGIVISDRYSSSPVTKTTCGLVWASTDVVTTDAVSAIATTPATTTDRVTLMLCGLRS
jgi:hypothetical protein